jgi:asparagine synthase (glutamine-hydrolysing)
MTGIVGVVGEKSSRKILSDSLSQTDYRARDGVGIHSQQNAHFGHQHFYTKETELGEDQPIEHHNNIFLFDGRIDNRLEICKILDLPNEGHSDAELIAHCYSRFDRDFVKYIIGPYSISIFNNIDNELYLYRDLSGVRQLYFSKLKDGLIFGSEVSNILQHPHIIKEKNSRILKEYKSGRIYNQSETFYDSIYRVPSGGEVVYELDSGDIVENHNEPVKSKHYKRENSTQKSFQDVFSTAIEDRLRMREPAVMMSSGIDSTTIAKFLCDIDHSSDSTPAFSLVFKRCDIQDESCPISDVASILDIDLNIIDGCSHWPLSNTSLRRELFTESPCQDVNADIYHRLYQEASNSGTISLFSGYGGNLYDGSKIIYSDLLMDFNISSIVSEYKKDNEQLSDILFWYGIAPIIARKLSQIYNQLPLATDREIQGNYDNKVYKPLSEIAKQRSISIRKIRNDYIFRKYIDQQRDFGMAAERISALKAGVEPVYPWLDIRLITLLFNSNTRDLFKNGRRKHLVKEELSRYIVDIDRKDTDFDKFAIDGMVKWAREETKHEMVNNRAKLNAEIFNKIEIPTDNINNYNAYEIWEPLSIKIFKENIS